mgnify:CR=1 FL=1
MDRARGVRAGRLMAILAAGASLAACATVTPHYAVRGGGARPHAQPPGGSGLHGTNAPYQVGGIWYVPHDQPNYDETGTASWYGQAFQMKATADGEIFDMNEISAAHTTLPLPSMVEVTNLDNGRKLTVRVNDRGPFVGNRIIDLSHAAARELGYDRAGLAHVRVRYLGPAPLAGPEAGVRYARATRTPMIPGAAISGAAISGAAVSGARISGAARRPADEDIFQEAAITPTTPKPLVAPPEAVSVSALPSLPPVRTSRDVYVLDLPVHRTVAPETRVASAQAYRIQAGAFSDEDNARRAAAELASAGPATIEPFEQSGVTFYRVYVPGPSDEAQAYAVRDKVAAIGFADARVLRP